MSRPDITAWPAPVVEALRHLGIDAAQATRADGRISLKTRGPRIDLHRLGDGAVALSAVLVRLPSSEPARESLVLRALARSRLEGGRWPLLAIAGDELLFQLRVDRGSLATFERELARFAGAATSERARLQQAPSAPPPAAFGAPTISWRPAHDPNPWR